MIGRQRFDGEVPSRNGDAVPAFGCGSVAEGAGAEAGHDD
jgi:hypothetical protein